MVRAGDGRVVPWRNGLGSTRELLRVPDDDGWAWRLSIATSDGPAPFSSYDGVDRELLLLSGAGLDLAFGPGPASVVRLAVGESHRFAGEAAVTGTPVAGPTAQLNLMWRRDVVAARLVSGPAPSDLLEGRVGGPAEVVVVEDLETPVYAVVLPAPETTSPARKPAR